MNDNAQHKNYEYDIFNMQVSFQMSTVEECQTSYSTTNVCTAAMVFAMKNAIY